MPTSSRENGIVFFGSKDKSEVWRWRHFSTGQKRALQSWFRWELPGTLIYHTVLDDVYYTVCKSGSSYNIEGYDIKQQSDTTTISHPNTVNIYDVYLDSMRTIAKGDISYSATTKKSSCTTPAGIIYTGKQLAVFCNTADPDNKTDNVGRFALASINGSNVEWDGDWTENNIILGYVYDWEVELPTLYRQQMAGKKLNLISKLLL